MREDAAESAGLVARCAALDATANRDTFRARLTSRHLRRTLTIGCLLQAGWAILCAAARAPRRTYTTSRTNTTSCTNATSCANTTSCANATRCANAASRTNAASCADSASRADRAETTGVA